MCKQDWFPETARNDECQDIDQIEAIVNVDRVRPLHLIDQNPSRIRRGDWVRESKPFLRNVPNPNWYVVWMTEMGRISNISRYPAHRMPLPPIVLREILRNQFNTPHML